MHRNEAHAIEISRKSAKGEYLYISIVHTCHSCQSLVSLKNVKKCKKWNQSSAK